MHRQRIRGCGKAKYLISQTGPTSFTFPLLGGEAPHPQVRERPWERGWSEKTVQRVRF